MDRNAFVKAVWQAKLVRQITATHYLIARAMVRMARQDGRLWPSREHLADAVGCSARTVARATARLNALGLLEWDRRRLPGRRCYTSNLYRIRSSPPVGKKEGISLESSAANLSHGSPRPLPATVAAALERLGRAMGCSAAEAMPWLSAPS